ncbi:zinc dependent phospholipase C family protein [Bacillus niameyensis]|uniref:zinc dependent phospholipase C family protein n=1 Tax=Bacillus niameyensis TaxID=1522308 RepID=UPI000783CFE6|nr:zinc dependent phospholipase C family protein [Bacillus niameyensis]
MGSRIMHAIIGYKIAESLAIVDQTSFLLGSVAPDAVFSFEEKNLSHFFIGNVRDYSRRVDFEGFLHKYKEQVERENPYIMGYCTHLVADDIWLRGFNLSWLKNRMDADEGLYQLYHNDFRLLNGKLLEYYGLTNELKKAFSHFPNIIDLQEVKSNDVEKFVSYVLGDMNFNRDILNANLQVFTFDMIVGYIETSIEVGLLKIKPLLD